TVPVFTKLPSDQTVEATAVNTPIADVDFGTIEAADIFGVTLSNDAPATFPLGDTIVTWTATDGNGLTATADQVITVVDTTAPVFTFVPEAKSVYATGIKTMVDIGLATATDIFGATVSNDAAEYLSDGFPVGKTTVTWTATDGNGLTTTATQDIIVTYDFAGFFQPVDMNDVVNTVKAGSAIPIKFSLGGNMGLNIFAAGYPKVVAITVDSSTQTDEIETTVTAGNSSLSYDPATDQYTYVWKTDKAWVGLGKKLIVRLNDGTEHYAKFLFKK
ncbi:MAG: HYR domain-containing protein, partial [Ruminiclostridium sp.]|nr:HYR domain-containing protein [Ruminiclostridium sp.]